MVRTGGAVFAAGASAVLEGVNPTSSSFFCISVLAVGNFLPVNFLTVCATVGGTETCASPFTGILACASNALACASGCLPLTCCSASFTGIPFNSATAFAVAFCRANAPRLVPFPALAGLVPSTGLSNPATSVGAVSLAPSGVSLPATTAGLS